MGAGVAGVPSDEPGGPSAPTSAQVVESPSLEVSERRVDVALRDTVQWWIWQCELNGWT